MLAANMLHVKYKGFTNVDVSRFLSLWTTTVHVEMLRNNMISVLTLFCDSQSKEYVSYIRFVVSCKQV